VKVVLFACVHNAGRSQMAAAIFDALADRSKAAAISAGTDPASRVHGNVVAAMREIGIDLSAATPRLLTPELLSRANVFIAVGCKQRLPVQPGLEIDSWSVDDPVGLPLSDVRAIRDTIRGRMGMLLAARGWLPTEPPPEVRARRAREAARDRA
jgi:arsenate reductase